jgi:hypothetical protein
MKAAPFYFLLLLAVFAGFELVRTLVHGFE